MSTIQGGERRGLAGRLLHYGLGVAASILILAMMLLTAADVALRYVLNAPILGAFELTELMLAALIFCGLPLATERDEHVDVDLVHAVMPPVLARTNVVVVTLISTVGLFVLSSQLFVRAQHLAEDNTVTNSLALPIAPVGYLMAATTALSGLILLVRFGRELVALLARPGAGPDGHEDDRP